MFRYEVTTKIRTAVPLCWFVWARSEHEARVKQAESLNTQASQYAPPWRPDELIAVLVGSECNV